LKAIHLQIEREHTVLDTFCVAPWMPLPSRVFMNPNGQALLDVLAGFDADFVAALEQQQADKLTAQELEALWSSCSTPTSSST
jgi:hypothetical protein